MEETQEQDPVKIRRSTYNKERYEANKDYILKYRKERYASLNKKQYGIKVQTGEFVLNFD
jgi:spore coat protein CotH